MSKTVLTLLIDAAVTTAFALAGVCPAAANIDAGFLLNNEMSDFNPISGNTDYDGKVRMKLNRIQQQKHPRLYQAFGHSITFTDYLRTSLGIYKAVETGLLYKTTFSSSPYNAAISK